ncbi:MAG: FliA/WhiG family RNA polymerase sigma factor [Terriglobia bacterium]
MSLTLAVAPPATCSIPADPLQEMVHSSLPGVRFLANRIASRLPAHVDVEDLIQVGLIGLLQSADRFDPGRGVKFQTYANRRVEGAMLDYLRSLDWRPRSVRRRNRELEEAASAAEQRLGESASQEDLARELGVSVSELDHWIQDSCSSGDWFSGDYPEQDFDEGSRDLLAELADPSDSPEETVEKAQTHRVMAEAVNHLPVKERSVISLYYYEHRTMREIGRVLGVKQGRVSQLHSQAIARLRKRMQTVSRKRPCGMLTPIEGGRQAAA